MKARYRKYHKLKRKTPFFKKRYFWVLLLILILFSTGIYYVFFSDVFKINQIEISGNNKISTEDIKNLVTGQLDQKVILFVRLSKTAKTITEKFPEAESVSLKRRFPSSVSLSVEERKPFAVWCNQTCFNSDEEGIIFERTNNTSGFLIRTDKDIVIGKSIVSKNELNDIFNIKNDLVKKTNIATKEFLYLRDMLTLKTEEGWQAYFDPTTSLSNQSFNLIVSIQEKIPSDRRGDLEYIDLRYGNKVFYKYKSTQ